MLNVETCVSSQTFDVAVIGGGFSRISTALHCVKHGLSVCLVEKQLAGVHLAVMGARLFPA